MANPIDPVRVLAERLKEIAAAIGLDLAQCSVVVGTEHSPDHLQVVFTINEEIFGKDLEKQAEDKQFADLERSFKEQAFQDKAEEAKASLEALLNRHKSPPKQLEGD